MQGRLDQESEQTLIDQCRRRNYEAFGKLIDAYQSRVIGYIRRMVRDQDDALDIAQEVFIRAYQAFDRFDGRASLRTWLFRIAHNLCIDRARRADRMPVVGSLESQDGESETLDVADVRWDPQQIALDGEVRAVLEDGLASMSDKLKTVLLMHDGEDMGYEEIAAAIDVPIGTVKSRLFLARAHLKKCLEAYRRGEVTR